MPDKVFKLRSFIMAGKMRNRNCHGQVQYDEYARKSLAYDPVEKILLTHVRFFAECFLTAWTRNWVRSANYAAQYFGANAGTVDAQSNVWSNSMAHARINFSPINLHEFKFDFDLEGYPRPATEKRRQYELVRQKR